MKTANASRIVTEKPILSPELFGNKKTSGDIRTRIVIGHIKLTRKNVDFLANVTLKVIRRSPFTVKDVSMTSEVPSDLNLLVLPMVTNPILIPYLSTTILMSHVWRSKGKFVMSRLHDVSETNR